MWVFRLIECEVSDDMEALKAMLKNNEVNRLMIFYGPETFMREFYLKKTVETVIGDGELTMNYDAFSDKKTTLETIRDSVETMPFFADRRIVVLKNLDLLGKNKMANDLAEKLMNLPETTYVIIDEDEVDKRKKLYKTVKKLGHIVEFPYLSEGDMVKYIARGLGRYGKKISASDARHMIHYVGGNLTVMHNEIEKLAGYLGDAEVATKEAIDEICQKSVESKIFELVDCMGTNRRSRAVKLYHDLLLSKEPANRVLFMLTRQFRMIYRSKLMAGEGLGQNDIASKLKVQSFIVRKCLDQGRSFNLTNLEHALEDALQTEIDIRTGVFHPNFAVEQLIVKYSG